MNKVKFKLDVKGLNELMKSAPMHGVLEDVGEKVAQATGKGDEYGVRVHDASFVAIANVYPDSPEAAHDNYENNTLLKAVGSTGLPQTKPG